MKRLLLCAGVDGQAGAIERLRQFASERKPDAILFAGGILSPQRDTAVRSTLWCLTLEDERFVHGFFKVLSQLAPFSAVIPAPSFEPMEECCRLSLAAEMDFPHVHVVHATVVEERDLAVSGLGVIVREEQCMREDCYSRVQAKYFLRALARSDKTRKMLLLPETPPGVLGGPEANPIIGEIIDTLRPSLCVVGGQTPQRGLQRIASTLVVNPGRLADDSAVWLDWSKAEQVEFLGNTPDAAKSILAASR
jgi:hypothetical protein